MPVPVSGIDGWPSALDITLSVADRAPVAVGVKVMISVQLPPAATATLTAQVPARVNSAAFTPVKFRFVITSGALPVFVRVIVDPGLAVLTVCIPNPTEAGLRVTGGRFVPTSNPMPERLMLCGLPLAFVTMFMVAAARVAVDGVYVALIVHDAPTASAAPHVVFMAKGAAGLAMLVMFSGNVPVLVSVMVFGGLVVPIT